MRASVIPTLLFALVLAASATGCSIVPQPIPDAEINALAVDHADRVSAAQEPLSGSLSLYEAMARALKYNLDYRVEMMTQSLRGTEARLATTELLPGTVANAGYTGRDSYLTTTQLDIPTGLDFEPNSVSQDKNLNVADVTFSWHILDFALSYVKARQASDRYLIAQEAKRKVIQNTLEDVRTAYWRAYSSDRLVKKLRGLEGRVQHAIAEARQLSGGGEAAPVAALTFERELVQIRQVLQQLERDLILAKSQLAALINAAPGTEFTLTGGGDRQGPSMLGLSTREMVAEAVFNRPELHDLAYQRRINEGEADAALLELLPGLQLVMGDNFNSNSFLLNNQWTNWGALAASNLVRVFQYPARRDTLEAQDAILDQQALAMTMVVMTQVYVSSTRYSHFQREYEIAKDYNEVQEKLVAQIRAEAGADRVGEQTLIREEMNGLVAEVKRDIAFANVQTGAANVMVSMGLDLEVRDFDENLTVAEVAAQLQSAWSDRTAVSPRTKYLFELAKARAEAKRIQEEEARRVKQEAMLREKQEALERQRARDQEYRHRGSLKDGDGYGSLKDSGRHGSLKDDGEDTSGRGPHSHVPMKLGSD